MVSLWVLSMICFMLSQFQSVKAVEDDIELLSVFYANTELAQWWKDIDYYERMAAQIESLQSSNYDVLCLAELSIEKIQNKFVSDLTETYPYYYSVPRATNTSMCNCTTDEFEGVYQCLNESISEGDSDYESCWSAPDYGPVCSNCWSAYFDENIGLESIDICNAGDDYIPLPDIRPPPEDGSCVYGDGLMAPMIFSKYPLSDTDYKIFTMQSLMFAGVVDAQITKNDIDYHIFCAMMANYRHSDVMESQAMELEEYMIEKAAIDVELDATETIVLLGGDWNTGPKDDCAECVDWPDSNLTAYNILLDINPNMYSIYLDNFNEETSAYPLCVSCIDNLRNDDETVEYIGIQWFGFKGDKYNSHQYYIGDREWVEDVVQDLNTSLTDKYAVVIMQKEGTVVMDPDASTSTPISTSEGGDSQDGIRQFSIYTVHFLFVLNCYIWLFSFFF